MGPSPAPGGSREAGCRSNRSSRCRGQCGGRSTTRRTPSPPSTSGPPDPDLVTLARRAHVDVPGAHFDPAVHACRDRGAFEDELRKAPCLALLAHAHEHACGASPQPLTRRLESRGDELADSITDG